MPTTAPVTHLRRSRAPQILCGARAVASLGVGVLRAALALPPRERSRSLGRSRLCRACVEALIQEP